MVEAIEAVDPIDAVEHLDAPERVEAVIISGPRRGEIVCLPSEVIPEISEWELKLLNEAMDQVDASLSRLEAEVGAAIEVFSAPSRWL